MPRNWVLKNQTIIGIINQWPSTTGQLSRVEDMRGKSLREEGDIILTILADAKQLLLDEGAVQSIKKPLDPVWNKRFRAIKKLAITVAEEQTIAPEIFLRKKDLEALVRTKEQYGEYRIPKELAGWREQLLGAEILALLAQY